MLRLALFLLGISTAAASAAEISVSIRNGDVAVIAISGELLLGDEARFLRLAVAHPKAVVVLSGPGGNLRAGLEIGRTIRLRDYPTIVQVDRVCASACALAWLGGTPRSMHPTARVGFHAASMNGDVTSSGNALIGSYLSLLGLSDLAVAYLTSPQPHEMSWLTAPKARELGIDVQITEGLQPTPPSPVITNPLPRAPYPTTVHILPPQPSPNAGSQPSYADIMRRQLVAAARSFVGKHVSVSEMSELDIRTHIQSHYKNTIIRDRRERSRDDILAETLSFTRRWPERKYRLLPDTLALTCAPNAVCEATYEMAWTLTNQARRISMRGTSKVELVIRFSQHPPVIERESGQRLSSQSIQW